VHFKLEWFNPTSSFKDRGGCPHSVRMCLSRLHMSCPVHRTAVRPYV
jgi:hypothetical protein